MSNDGNPDRIDDTDNQNNNGFSAVILAVIVLACLWIVAGFTVFKYATLILLTAHFVNTFRLNSSSNHQETRIPPSRQICIHCSSRINNDSIFNVSTMQMKG